MREMAQARHALSAFVRAASPRRVGHPLPPRQLPRPPHRNHIARWAPKKFPGFLGPRISEATSWFSAHPGGEDFTGLKE